MLTATAAVNHIISGIKSKDNTGHINIDDEYHEEKLEHAVLKHSSFYIAFTPPSPIF